MFFAVRAGAPRSTVRIGSSRFTLGRLAGFGGSAGTPPRPPGLTGRDSRLGIGRSTVGVRRLADTSRAAGLASALGADSVAGAGAGPALVGGADCLASGCAAAEVGLAGADLAAVVDFATAALPAALAVAPLPPWPFGPPCAAKYCAQAASTESGSLRYCSYISSS